MIHGDIVTLTSEGIVVQEKALQPLGIFDQSICWGVWAANPHDDQPLYRHPNLIISPLHPASWPFLIQLQIILFNRKGALADVCEILKDHNLSILFAECAPTGFTHATLNLIAESTKEDLKDLRRQKEAFDKNNPWVRVPPSPAFDEARKIANSIAAHMFVHAKEIEQALEIKIENERSEQPESRIFHGWEDVGSHFLYNGEKVADEMLALTSTSEREESLEYIQAHIPKPARVHYMHRLAYFALYGGGRYHEVPFSLRYQASSAFLKLERKEVFSEGSFSNDVNPLPRPAICTFNSEDKYLRLNPLTSKLLKDKLTTIGVEYRVEGTHQRDARASQGLLWMVSDKLRTADVDLLYLSNKWTRLEYAYEAGRMSFIADVATDKYKAVEKEISSINDDKRHGELPNLDHTNIHNVSVEEYPQKKLFVSLHFGHPRGPTIEESIRKVAQERGFEAAFVETHVTPVTQNVVEIIRGCHAFLQLLYLRADETPDAISFPWLEFEYGVALGKGIPTIRLVDVVRLSYDWWTSKITINKDQRVKQFRSDVSNDEVIKQIREAVEELAQELTKRQQ